jgi:hypothetical protein
VKLSLAHLPRTARDLVDLIGLPAALALIEARAGQVITVPKRKRKAGHTLFEELADLIGADAAEKIVGRYGGEYLTVPSCKRAAHAVRDAELQARFDALLQEGQGARAVANQLAAEFGLDVSTVWRASKRAAADTANPAAVIETRQAELFA